eukprot:scaffold43598_cov30-Tisochrysis_lutea.AAC.3
MLAIALMASIGARVLFDNSRLRISDMRLAPGEAGGVEAHEFPTLRWQVGDGAHRRLHAGKEEEPATVADKATFWVEPGEPFRVLNCGKGEYRQICWEFKSPPRYTEEVVRKMLTEAKFTTDVGTALLFENSYCRAWDFCLAPGEDHSLEPHHHILDYAFVYVAKGRLLGYSADGKPGYFDSINEDGDVTWFDIPEGAGTDPKYAHGGKNGYDDLPMREYLVELK